MFFTKQKKGTEVRVTNVDSSSPPKKPFFKALKLRFWRSNTDMKSKNEVRHPFLRDQDPLKRYPKFDECPQIGRNTNGEGIYSLAGPTSVRAQCLEDASARLIRASSSNLVLEAANKAKRLKNSKRGCGCSCAKQESKCLATGHVGIKDNDSRVIRTESKESFVNVIIDVKEHLSPSSIEALETRPLTSLGEAHSRFFEPQNSNEPSSQFEAPSIPIATPKRKGPHLERSVSAPSMSPTDEDLLGAASWQAGLDSWSTGQFVDLEQGLFPGDEDEGIKRLLGEKYKELDSIRSAAKCLEIPLPFLSSSKPGVSGLESEDICDCELHLPLDSPVTTLDFGFRPTLEKIIGEWPSLDASALSIAGFKKAEGALNSISNPSILSHIHLRGGESSRTKRRLFQIKRDFDQGKDILDEHISYLKHCIMGYNPQDGAWRQFCHKAHRRISKGRQIVEEGSKEFDPKTWQDLLKRMKARVSKRHSRAQTEIREMDEEYDGPESNDIGSGKISSLDTRRFSFDRYEADARRCLSLLLSSMDIASLRLIATRDLRPMESRMPEPH